MLLWPIIMIRTENGKNGKNVSKASLAQENSSLENANVLRSLELKYAWIGFEPQISDVRRDRSTNVPQPLPI